MERRQVFLATVAFTICFSVWALMAPLAPEFRETYGLSELGTAVLIAAPVLLGSVLRIPLGILADRYGGRRVFCALLAFASSHRSSWGLSTRSPAGTRRPSR